MKHADIIQKLNLEQKCALLSGETVFTTRALPGKGIPAITLSDGPNGVRKQAGAADHLGLNPSVPATCFPTSSATACSWDEKLGEAVGEALGEEAAAQEVAVLLGPGLNIQRSPLCGRDFEYFSEDPILAGRMAAAYVRGIQKNGISACPKHFAVNSQELRRMASDSVLDERTLRELYLTGFEIVVKEAKPKTIMTSYNLINGTYANENAHLLQDILRKDWGFDGAVVTDWGGSNDHALGVKNGSTLEMPCPGGDSIRELMKAAAGELAHLPPVITYEPEYVERPPQVDTSDPLTIRHEDDVWIVEGPWLQKIMANVNFSNYESRNWFDRMLRNAGLFDRLEEMGIKDGDLVSLYNLDFEYQR